MKPFETSSALLKALATKVRARGEIFSFREEPLLASLVSCLGLEFELGKSDQDRVSVLLGVDLKSELWETEIIEHEGMFGLRAWVPGRTKELLPQHPDFAQILHPLSLVEGKLNQIVIFPVLVAAKFAERGIELVVVRDWVLAAFLGEGKLNYQRTNAYEIEEHIALTQIQLMKNKQLSFTGTHDLGDHLLGASRASLGSYDALVEDLKNKLIGLTTKRDLVISYLIAVMLDDLVQPQWYNSAKHLHVVGEALKLLETPGCIPAIFLPQSFHDLVKDVRDRKVEWVSLEQFAVDVSAEMYQLKFLNRCSEWGKFFPISPRVVGELDRKNIEVSIR